MNDWNRMRVLLVAVAAMALAVAPTIGQDAADTDEVDAKASLESATPQPSEIPIDWQFEFEPLHEPRPIRFRPPGLDADRTYWYVQYEVANRTGEEHDFIPDFTLYTDTGQILKGGSGVPTGVAKKVKELYNAPLLLSSSQITGKLLQGADNAKRGVVIFEDIDPAAGGFTIFVGGLSGETQTVELPRPVVMPEVNAEGQTVMVKKNKVTLARTLALTYDLPGEAASRTLTQPRLLRKYWVMR